MPSKYIVRNFVEGGMYHVYHRVRNLQAPFFRDENDYKTFLFYLYIYCKPVKQALKTYPALPFRLQINNLSQEIDVFAYALFPDHFHLIVRQHSKDALPRLMKQLLNAYTEYYNKKYSHKGSLGFGRYRAAQIENDKQMLALSRFVHLHSTPTNIEGSTEKHWNSLPEYLDETIDSFCNKRPILSYFSSPRHYTDYVNDLHAYKNSLPSLLPIIIEKKL